MSPRPDMTPQSYTATGPEQEILAALQRWARTSPWAARVAAVKAREYQTKQAHAAERP